MPIWLGALSWRLAGGVAALGRRLFCAGRRRVGVGRLCRTGSCLAQRTVVSLEAFSKASRRALPI